MIMICQVDNNDDRERQMNTDVPIKDYNDTLLQIQAKNVLINVCSYLVLFYLTYTWFCLLYYFLCISNIIIFGRNKGLTQQNTGFVKTELVFY